MEIPVTPEVRAQLAPSGRMRAGLNRSNFLLVNAASTNADPRGVAPDVALEIGRRLGVAVDFVCYPSPGELGDAAGADAWDVAFLGAEPARAERIDFSPAYVEIECTYLVPAGSPLKAVEEVDRDGVRISVSGRSAYDLYLSRSIARAQLLRSNGLDASYERFVAERLDALAGLRPKLEAEAKRLSGSRVLPGRFTAVQQSIGVPKGRSAGARWLAAFVEGLKATDFLSSAIERHGAHGLSVAPAARG